MVSNKPVIQFKPPLMKSKQEVVPNSGALRHFHPQVQLVSTSCVNKSVSIINSKKKGQ